MLYKYLGTAMALISSKRLYLSYSTLSKDTNLKQSAIKESIIFKTKLYRSFEIPKRTTGYRSVSIPPPTLSAIQKAIVKRIDKIIKFPNCVHGFVKKKSILTNARVHLSGQKFMKFDLENFFQNITYEQVEKQFSNYVRGWETLTLIKKCCFLNNTLPQGAPSSPILSNIASLGLDEVLTKYAILNNLAYSRYADDITFSGKKIYFSNFQEVKKLIQNEGFKLNEKKCCLITKGNKVIVTGISIGRNKMHLPKTQKRKLRMDAHFLLKKGAMNENFYKKKFDPFHLDRILGRLSFWLAVEPDNKFPKFMIKEIVAESKKQKFLN